MGAFPLHSVTGRCVDLAAPKRAVHEDIRANSVTAGRQERHQRHNSAVTVESTVLTNQNGFDFDWSPIDDRTRLFIGSQYYLLPFIGPISMVTEV
jgi:hypothetical protein